jgi:hypothetical protein
MWKYAGELRIGDLWTDRTEGGGTRSYRVIAIARGPAMTAMRVTGTCVITGDEQTIDLFPINRVKVRKERP